MGRPPVQVRHAVAAVAAAGLATTGLLAPISGASAADTGQPTAANARVATGYGMEHHAFGTRVDGNAAVRSGPTANSVIGCTTLAGLSRSNNAAAVDAGPLLTAEEISSRGVTTKENGVVAVTSRNTITRGSLAGGDVRFSGLSSQSRTWHDQNGFHNRVTMDLARLTVGGERVNLNGDTRKIEIRGTGTLTVFARSTRETAGVASAKGLVLRLVLDDGTRVSVGSSFSRMRAQVFGPMSGSTWGSQVRLGDGTVSSGRTAFQVMPCQGTDGVVRENATTGLDLPGLVTTTAITTHTWGMQRPTVQRGYTQAEIAKARIGSVGISAHGIVSKANVERDNGLTRNAQGTKLLELTVAGQDIRDDLKPGQPFKVPGVATFTFKKVTEVRNGIEVVALEIVLADGSNTVVELGHSVMRISQN